MGKTIWFIADRKMKPLSSVWGGIPWRRIHGLTWFTGRETLYIRQDILGHGKRKLIHLAGNSNLGTGY